MRKSEVIKASGAIHIKHSITLMQQQLWNILLAHAFPDLSSGKIFKITERDLLEYLPYYTRNTEHIKDALKVLNTTQVEYNIFDKDSREWGVYTLLAGAKLKNGVLTYGYYPELQELINNPRMYARINLLIQNRFSSKYSLFIYELCVDYRGVAQTPFYTLDEFKEYLGIEQTEYKEFKRFSQRVTNPAIKEINEKSDILIRIEYRRENKKISAIKFLIEDNPRKISQQLSLPLENGQEDFEGLTAAEVADPTPILRELVDVGASPKQAEAIVRQYTPAQIFQALTLIRSSRQKIKSPGGFLMKALKEGWQVKEGQVPPPPPEPPKISPEAQKRELERQERIKRAEAQYARMDNEARWQSIQNILKKSKAFQTLTPDNQLLFRQRLNEEVFPQIKVLEDFLEPAEIVISQIYGRQAREERERQERERQAREAINREYGAQKLAELLQNARRKSSTKSNEDIEPSLPFEEV